MLLQRWDCSPLKHTHSWLRIIQPGILSLLQLPQFPLGTVASSYCRLKQWVSPLIPSSVMVSICLDPPRKEKSLIKDNTSRRSSRQYLLHTSRTLWTFMKWIYMRLKAAVIVSWIIGIICKTKALKAAILWHHSSFSFYRSRIEQKEELFVVDIL